MKAVLVFTLPKEAWDHRMALRGATYHTLLSEVDNLCRTTLKHGGVAREALEAIRQVIREGREEDE